MEPIQLPDVNVSPPEDAVSLTPPADTSDEQVSISGNVEQNIPKVIAQLRAAKFHEALNPVLPMSANDLYQQISSGNENYLRKEAASKIDLDNAQKANKQIVDLGKSAAPLDMAIVQSILSGRSKVEDPDTVLEKAYGKVYIDNPIESAISTMHESPVARAKLLDSEAFDRLKERAAAATSRIEYATTVKENLGLQISQQSWPSFLGDQAKNLFQPYVEYEMRGVNPKIGKITGGVLLGTNLLEQAEELLSPITTPDFAEYKFKLKAISDKLAETDPTLAYHFVEYVEGLPTTDKYLDNLFTVLAIPDYLGISRLGLSVVRRLNMMNRTQTALKQLVKEAKVIEEKASVGIDPVVSRAEAVGDTSTAATERSAKIVEDTISGKSDPIKIATDDSLTTNLKLDSDNIATDKGLLSREQVVRIQNQFQAAAEKIIKTITDAVRINRIPMAVATANAVRVIKESVKEYYPGLRNAILDISNPLYDSKSNTYWHEITMGNFGGDLFTNSKTAYNFAQLHGLEADIVEATGRVTPAATEKMLTRKTQLEKNIAEAEASSELYGRQAKDKKITPEEKTRLQGEIKGLEGFAKGFQKELDDINLKLKGGSTYERVQHLEGETAHLRTENKETRARLKKSKNLDPGNEAIIRQILESNEDRVKANLAEVKAIKEGKAEVVARPATIEQHGVGFKIVVRRPLVETDKSVRDLMIRDVDGNLIKNATGTSSQEVSTLKGLIGSIVGKYRSAEDTLALNESIQRAIGTYSQSLFKKWAADEIKYIKQLATGVLKSDPVTGEPIPYWRAKPVAIWNRLATDDAGRFTKDRFEEWVRTIDYARDAPDPKTAKPGYFFQTPFELQNHFRTFFDRPPTFAEHEAYFAYVRLIEGDRIFREISEFRNRARLGTEQHQISFRGPDGKQIQSDYFDGVVRKNFPGGDDVMMIVGKRKGEEKIINLGGAGLAPKVYDQYVKDVKEGRKKVIEIYAPEHTPLRDWSDIAGNDMVRYVLIDNVDHTKPLEYNHVNRRGGGHFEYDYDHYIKQAKMFHQYEESKGIKGRYRSVYMGDQTFMPVENRVMGADIARRMNEGRLLLKAENLTEDAFDLLKLPFGKEEFEKFFKAGRDDKGKILPAQYDLNEPFEVVKNGRSVMDLGSGLQDRYGKAFKDGTHSGSLNKQFSTAFNTERDAVGLRTIINEGDHGSPTYKFEKAKLVDPMSTMQRALNRITSSIYMDDYKLYAIEHWMREAEPHLTKINKDLARSASFFVFKSAENKSAFAAGTDENVIRNLLSNRFKINQFVGIPGNIQNAIESGRQILIDAAYRGVPGANIPLWMISHKTDPVSAMRAIVSHEKLGLYNPIQFLVQSGTFTNISAISPKAAMSGTLATFLHTASVIKSDDRFINFLDNLATKMHMPLMNGWKPGEFKEANRILREQTGFGTVANEYADLHNTMKSDFLANDAKTLLNGGLIFFKLGEQAPRLAGWYTAFKEFRELFPTKAITRDDIGFILKRADLLTNNMSRASSSGFNQGIFSLPTQFLTYTQRQSELFVGNRLGTNLVGDYSASEKWMARGRLLLWNSLLYGSPVGVGVSGLALSESIRKEAIQRGYVIGENWYSTVAMEGFPSWFVGKMTGTFPNIGERFGSPGMTQFRDALRADKAWYWLMAGAAGTSLANTLGSLSPYWNKVKSMLEPDNSKKEWPLTNDDMIGMFKEVSTVNQGIKGYTGIKYGNWVSKNEQVITKVSGTEAFLLALTGTQPQKQSDAYLKSNIRKTEVEAQKVMLKEFIKEYHRYMDAARDNDPQQGKAYFKRADAILELGGYPIDKRADAMAIAVRSYKGQIEETDFDFFTKDVPPLRKDFMGIPMPFTTQKDLPTTRKEQFRTEQKLNRTP